MTDLDRGEMPTKCPACGGRIRMSRGKSMKVGWNCTNCSAFSFAEHDHPDITKGKKMAPQFKGVPVMDRRMTSLPTNTQIGILRVLQHPHDERYGIETTFIDPADGKRKEKPDDHTCDKCQQ